MVLFGCKSIIDSSQASMPTFEPTFNTKAVDNNTVIGYLLVVEASDVHLP